MALPILKAVFDNREFISFYKPFSTVTDMKAFNAYK